MSVEEKMMQRMRSTMTVWRRQTEIRMEVLGDTIKRLDTCAVSECEEQGAIEWTQDLDALPEVEVHFLICETHANQALDRYDSNSYERKSGSD